MEWFTVEELIIRYRKTGLLVSLSELYRLVYLPNCRLSYKRRNTGILLY